MDAVLELVIALFPGAVPLRISLRKRITSIGSEPGADIRLTNVPPRWVVVERDPDVARATVSDLASGVDHILEVGHHVVIGDATLSLVEAEAVTDTAAVERLALSLSSVSSAQEALDTILDGVMEAAGADTGAVVLSDAGAYRVACAKDAEGGVLEGAAELLSDTIVRDVLGTGERVFVTDVDRHSRYASIPSVTSMRLRSIVCLPLRAESQTLGALFLGKRGGATFGERLAAELRMLTALALPFLAQLRAPGRAGDSDDLLGDSESIAAIRRMVRKVGPSDLSVLIAGESGTGKELVARAIHAASARSDRPMVSINCAAIPESLLAGELFGYKKGAFSGAVSDRAGLIEAAEGTTLFLDEVGDMPLAMQSALLRVLEQREVTRLGENRPRPVDFRLITASHRDLDERVKTGEMREDLLFRLREITIDVPALRARGGDVLLLAQWFLRQVEQRLGLATHHLDAEAKAALAAHPFPGNVRELKATMRRAAILADSSAVTAEHLGLRPASRDAGLSVGDLDRPLAEARDEFVKQYVGAVLERCGGDRQLAAEKLGIGVRTLYRYLS